MTDDATWSDTMPQSYDRCLGPALFAPYARQVATVAAQLAPARILELAAGTGIGTAELVRQLSLTAVITATDLNPAMVAWAEQHVPGASWATADAQLLDFADASFELVVCQFGVMFFPDKPAAFAEAARVLAPDGVLLCTVWDAVEHSDFPAALVASLAAVCPVDPPDFIVRVPHGYADPDGIRADLVAGGLRVEAIERRVLRGQAPSAAVLAEGFCAGTPLRFALQQRGELGEMTARVAAEMTRRLGAGPVEGDLAAYVITARKPTAADR